MIPKHDLLRLSFDYRYLCLKVSAQESSENSSLQLTRIHGVVVRESERFATERFFHAKDEVHDGWNDGIIAPFRGRVYLEVPNKR